MEFATLCRSAFSSSYSGSPIKSCIACLLGKRESTSLCGCQGYFLQDVPDEDPELTHVGPGTAMGEYLRRFWQPVCMSEDLRDLPRSIPIMGEDLVAFRYKSGQFGVLHRHFSRRGTSLEYCIVAERGIRCCYHGWLFDADGTILETPGEPPNSKLRESFRHGAYPTHEEGGLVFAYVGPSEYHPDFPKFDGYDLWDIWMKSFEVPISCNWLQVTDNYVDPAHSQFLHNSLASIHFFGELWAQTLHPVFRNAGRKRVNAQHDPAHDRRAGLDADK